MEALQSKKEYDHILHGTERIIPAGWCLHSFPDCEWVEIVALKWWQSWRLLLLDKPNYWPLRILIRSRIVWTSKAINKGNNKCSG